MFLHDERVDLGRWSLISTPNSGVGIEVVVHAVLYRHTHQVHLLDWEGRTSVDNAIDEVMNRFHAENDLDGVPDDYNWVIYDVEGNVNEYKNHDRPEYRSAALVDLKLYRKMLDLYINV